MGEQSSEGGHALHTDHKRAPWWCYALLLAAVCSVASAGVAFKWIGDVPPITLASWRLQITTVITAVAGLIQWQAMSAEHKARFWRDYRWTLFSGVCLAVHFGTWVWSLENTSLAHSLLLVSTTPIILVVFALVMRHAISYGEIAGAVLAVLGVGVLAAGAATGNEAEVTLLGDLSAIAAAVSVALHWHAGKHLRTYQPVFVYSAPVTAIAALMLMLTGLAVEEHTLVGSNRHGIFGWTCSTKYAPFVVYLGAVPGIVGHQGFNTVLKYMAPLAVSLAVQFEPVVGPVIGWAVGVSLAPGIYTWIGGAIVLLAAAGATVATARRQEQEEQQSKHGMMRLPTQDLDHFELDIDTLDAAADTPGDVRDSSQQHSRNSGNSGQQGASISAKGMSGNDLRGGRDSSPEAASDVQQQHVELQIRMPSQGPLFGDQAGSEDVETVAGPQLQPHAQLDSMFVDLELHTPRAQRNSGDR